jgi:D-alanine-D-alanine ligase
MNFGKVGCSWAAKILSARSLMSGNGVLKALFKARMRLRSGRARPVQLRREGYARCFIALHGRGGEDGTLQGALEVLGLPYTGSGVLGSALAMDKARTKLVWQASGLPTPAFEPLYSDSDMKTLAGRLGLPLVVKPVQEGSSLGITKVRDAALMDEAFALAVNYDRVVIAERLIDGPEYTASILDDAPLPLIRIEAPDGEYDYQNKYFTDVTQYHCPAGCRRRRKRR